MKQISGSIVALVTPFNEDGSVDHGRLRALVDWHIANGTDAILTLGTTGETASTTLEEDTETETEVPALTIYRKRDVNVEIQRQSKTRSTEITADEFYAAVLSNEAKVVLAKFKV